MTQQHDWFLFFFAVCKQPAADECYLFFLTVEIKRINSPGMGVIFESCEKCVQREGSEFSLRLWIFSFWTICILFVSNWMTMRLSFWTICMLRLACDFS